MPDVQPAPAQRKCFSALTRPYGAGRDLPAPGRERVGATLGRIDGKPLLRQDLGNLVAKAFRETIRMPEHT